MKQTKSGYIGLLENDWIEIKNPLTRKRTRLYRIISLRTFRIDPLGWKSDVELESIQNSKKRGLDELESIKSSIEQLSKKIEGIKSTKTSNSKDIDKISIEIEQLKYKEKQILRDLSKLDIDTKIEIPYHTIGGFVESLDNVDDENPVWIDNNCKVFGNAKVLNGSHLVGSVKAYGNCTIESSYISDYVKIHENANIKNSFAGQLSELKGNCVIDKSFIFNSSMIFERANVEKSILENGCIVRGDAKVFNTVMKDISQVQGNSVLDTCILYGRYTSIDEELQFKTLDLETELQTTIGR